MENLMTIGEFAEATRISPKALRLYAEHLLLTPTRVDGDSGYRYYRAEQLPVARLIALLRSADMPLKEIRRFLVDGDVALLDGHAQRLRQRLEVLDYVRTVIEEAPMFEVKVKQVEPQQYVSKTTNVHVGGLAAFITSTIGELAEGGIEGPPFCVFHGAVNESDDGPIEVGVPRAGGDRELEGGEVAFVSIDESNSKFPEVLGAYDAIARWAKERGREFGGAPREVYLSAPGEPQRWEVVWPLR